MSQLIPLFLFHFKAIIKTRIIKQAPLSLYLSVLLYLQQLCFYDSILNFFWRCRKYVVVLEHMNFGDINGISQFMICFLLTQEIIFYDIILLMKPAGRLKRPEKTKTIKIFSQLLLGRRSHMILKQVSQPQLISFFLFYLNRNFRILGNIPL